MAVRNFKLSMLKSRFPETHVLSALQLGRRNDKCIDIIVLSESRDGLRRPLTDMHHNLLIFAGAGASCGVSKEKYPTAIDFRRRLPEAVTKTQLFIHLNDYLTRTRDKAVIDIEHVLWELGRLIEALEEMTGQEVFAAELLTKNHIHIITGHQNQGPATYSQLSQLKQLALTLQNHINQNVYEFYAKAPTNEELRRSWVPLLEWASTSDFAQIDLVTTNYDLAFPRFPGHIR